MSSDLSVQTRQQRVLSRYGSTISESGGAHVASTSNHHLSDGNQIGATRKALAVPELLALVFAETDLATCATAACVCRAWYDLASNELWRALPSPLPLFTLLAPLRLSYTQTGNAKVFSRPLVAEDWRRFLNVSNRIRSLELHEVDKGGQYDSSIFNVIAHGRPVMTILPCLRALSVRVATSTRALETVIFYSPTVTTFKLHRMGSIKPITELYSIQQITRMPKLSSITLFGCLNAASTFTQVLETLQKLEHLDRLALDTPHAGAFIPPLMASLGTLPSLKHLCITSNDFPVEMDVSIPIVELAAAENSKFPSLESLIVVCRGIRTLSSVFSTHTFCRLVELNITTWDDGAVLMQDVEALLAAIASVGASLDSLAIEFRRCRSAPNPLTALALEPIISTLRLKHLTIAHELPLDLSQTDVVSLAQVLGPSIETLQLNPYPKRYILGQVQLDLSALVPIAQHCLHLRQFAIFLNGVLPLSQDSLGEIKFPPSLTQINFGHSPMVDRGDVADYLIDLGCPDIAVEQAQMVLRQHILDWIVVGEVMDLQSRRESRRKKNPLVEENEALERSREKNRATRRSYRAESGSLGWGNGPFVFGPDMMTIPPALNNAAVSIADEDSSSDSEEFHGFGNGLGMGMPDSDEDGEDDDDSALEFDHHPSYW